MKKEMIQKIIPIAIIFLLVILVFNTLNVYGLQSSLNEKISEAKELAKPAKVDLITLTSSCLDCFDIESVRAVLKETTSLEIVNDEVIDGNSAKAKELILKYAITKLPTIVIKGEVDKTSIQNFVSKDNVLIFQGVTAPYFDTSTKKVKGKVKTVVITDKRCKDCADLTTFVKNFEQGGVMVNEQNSVDAQDKVARELIKKFNIGKLPALLISDDIDVYPIAEKIKQSGLIANKGFYLVESTAPYIESKTGRIRGNVELTLVTDKSCTECYDVNLHKQILANVGMNFKDVKTIDVNSAEGVKLRLERKIEKVPTVIISGDVAAYEGFEQIWKQVGTVEKDGSYIFRDLAQLGNGIKFKNLVTGSVESGGASTP